MLVKMLIPAALAVAIAVSSVAGANMTNGIGNDPAKRAASALPSISLQKAIETAKSEIDGKVIAAAVKRKDGKAFYWVELLTAEHTEKEILVDVKDVLISMKTGKVAKVLAGDQR